jgi:hypothetical protein
MPKNDALTTVAAITPPNQGLYAALILTGFCVVSWGVLWAGAKIMSYVTSFPPKPLLLIYYSLHSRPNPYCWYTTPFIPAQTPITQILDGLEIPKISFSETKNAFLSMEKCENQRKVIQEIPNLIDEHLVRTERELTTLLYPSLTGKMLIQVF